jgi:hypothetical protein
MKTELFLTTIQDRKWVDRHHHFFNWNQILKDRVLNLQDNEQCIQTFQVVIDICNL